MSEWSPCRLLGPAIAMIARMFAETFRAATSIGCRFATLASPRSQVRLAPPVSQTCAQDRSVSSLRSTPSRMAIVSRQADQREGGLGHGLRAAGRPREGAPEGRGTLTVRTLVMYRGHMKITATDFKDRCLRLLDEIGRTGEELVILKRGRPVARVIAAREEKPWLALRGRGAFVGDPFAGVVDESDIEALR